jgi:hypothetical protein
MQIVAVENLLRIYASHTALVWKFEDQVFIPTYYKSVSVFGPPSRSGPCPHFPRPNWYCTYDIFRKNPQYLASTAEQEPYFFCEVLTAFFACPLC